MDTDLYLTATTNLTSNMDNSSLSTNLSSTFLLRDNDSYYWYYNDSAYDQHNTGVQSRWSRFLTQPHQLLAVFLSLAAILLNVFSLLAISRVQHRITTHFLFIISLALSDIAIGVNIFFILNAVSFSTLYSS